ncbi:MAG: fimbria major subunit [Duncaniella sp.]|nr:fimbria major subunit [Duncaniella sp.]
MKTFSKILTGFAVSLAVAGCSSDEPVNTPTPDTPDADGKVYLNVKINDANTLSRATDGGYEDGVLDEHKVVRADFFFYDANGRFVFRTNLTDMKGEASNDENIEYFTENLIVIQGLTQSELPTYMVTLLNGPTVTPGATMKSLAEDVMFETLRNNDGNFYMSTTSFFGQPKGETDRHDDSFYYATKLKSTDFYAKAEDAQNADPVNIYVERLAAKFTLSGIKMNEYYPVTTVVAGNDNGNLPTGAPEAGTELYVMFDGWGITGQEKKSHLSKVLDSEWNPAGIDNWTSWNHSDYHRSYWGKSVSYGSKTPDLTTVTYEDATNNVENAIYAHETTNTADNIRTENGNLLIRSRVTSVILTATVYEKDADDNKVPANLVLYNGVYYRKEQFISYALNIVNTSGELNYYICENPDAAAGETKHYRQVSTDDMKLVKKKNTNTGRVEVAFNKPAETLYARSVVDGNETFTAIDGGAEKLNNALRQNLTDMRDAVAYTNGKMFYSIPVEHLARTVSNGTYTVDGEGDYGVVRNHWYRVSVGNVMNMGNGIFIPEKVDDPTNPDDPEDPEPLIPEDPTENKWALRAVINVLSWKIVNQSVDI